MGSPTPPTQMQDPQSGTRISVQLRMLRTRLPGEAEASPSFLLSEDAGVLAHASSAARGSIQKAFAVEGLALYWQPGSSSSQGSGGTGGGGGGQAEAAAPASRPASPFQPAPRRKRRHKLPPPPPAAYLLHPTDIDIHTTLQLSAPGTADGSSGIRVHAAAVLHHLQLSLSAGQATDVLVLSDRLAWCAARNRVAAYCPEGWRGPGPRTVPWR